MLDISKEELDALYKTSNDLDEILDAAFSSSSTEMKLLVIALKKVSSEFTKAYNNMRIRAPKEWYENESEEE